MERWLTPWLLLYVAISAGILGTYVVCPGCLERDRDNSRCEWTGDATFPFDPRSLAQQAHLIQDAQLAEELAVRYADAENLRLHGVEHHGGLIESGNVLLGCMSRMFAAIESHHAVTAEQIRAARAQRNRAFDAAVIVLFLPIYWLGVTAVLRGLSRRFSEDRRSVQLIAAGLMSVVVSFVGFQLHILWGALWSTIRLGNGHVGGYRLARIAWLPYASALIIGGVLLFWLILLLYRRIPWNVVLTAAALTCTLTGVVFAHTFRQMGVVTPFVVLSLIAAAFWAGRESSAPLSHRHEPLEALRSGAER
jgi:hypothetical protein